MADDSISDKARGNDAIFPMFSATVWDAVGNTDRVKQNFDKVLNKAEAWVNYNQKHDVKLQDYDRLMSTVPFVLQKARDMKDFATGARAADLIYQDTGDPAYKAMADQMRAQGGGIVPAPAGQELPPASDN
jgi:hypothetical protein